MTCLTELLQFSKWNEQSHSPVYHLENLVTWQLQSISNYITPHIISMIVLYQSSSLHTKLYQTISKYIIYKLSIPKYIISRCVFSCRWRPSDGCSPPWLPIRSSSMTLCRATETDKTWGHSRHSDSNGILRGLEDDSDISRYIPIEYCFYDDSLLIPIQYHDDSY